MASKVTVPNTSGLAEVSKAVSPANTAENGKVEDTQVLVKNRNFTITSDGSDDQSTLSIMQEDSGDGKPSRIEMSNDKSININSMEAVRIGHPTSGTVQLSGAMMNMTSLGMIDMKSLGATAISATHILQDGWVTSVASPSGGGFATMAGGTVQIAAAKQLRTFSETTIEKIFNEKVEMIGHTDPDDGGLGKGPPDGQTGSDADYKDGTSVTGGATSCSSTSGGCTNCGAGSCSRKMTKDEITEYAPKKIRKACGGTGNGCEGGGCGLTLTPAAGEMKSDTGCSGGRVRVSKSSCCSGCGGKSSGSSCTLTKSSCSNSCGGCTSSVTASGTSVSIPSDDQGNTTTSTATSKGIVEVVGGGGNTVTKTTSKKGVYSVYCDGGGKSGFKIKPEIIEISSEESVDIVVNGTKILVRNGNVTIQGNVSIQGDLNVSGKINGQ